MRDSSASGCVQLKKQTLAFIGLGSNLGEGRANLMAAWQRLGQVSGIRLLKLSSPYLTEPVGMNSRQWFTNAVGEIVTSLAPDELLAALLAIEAELGRDRSLTRDRPVDLDLLYYGKLRLNTSSLTVPHPHLAERLFVLAPLAELAPELVHPLLGLSTMELIHNLRNQEKVERRNWPPREHLNV